MADTIVTRPARIATLACAGLLATLAGCASVAEDATMAKTVTPASATNIAATDGTTTEVAYAALPAAKPGTENTPEALPTPIAVASDAAAGAVPVSALAEAKPVTGAAAATAALAGNTGETMTAVAEVQQSYDTVIGVSVMEPGFDTGKPEGLEQLVASRKIVPMAKPALVSNAVLTTQTRLMVPQAEQPFTKSGTPIDALITKYAALYGIPESLLHRVVKRESTYNPRAFNRGHYGLMQIKYATAKSMGYEGPAEGLFDAETNIKYAGKYLRGAWMVADDKNDGAVRLYAAGYYYHAKRKGLLDETGLR
jgi:hypothetical protein